MEPATPNSPRREIIYIVLNNMSGRCSGLFRNDITRNPFVWGALALCTGLLVAAVYIPGLSDILKVVHPGTKGGILVIAMSMVPLATGQIVQAMMPAAPQEVPVKA